MTISKDNALIHHWPLSGSVCMETSDDFFQLIPRGRFLSLSKDKLEGIGQTLPHQSAHWKIGSRKSDDCICHKFIPVHRAKGVECKVLN